jgi:hypothetical protein
MKRSSLLFRIALSVTVLIFCCAGLSAQVTLKPTDWPIPGTLFGLHCHHVGKNGVWPSIQFYDLRLWDSFTDWPTLESQRGKWDFSNLDRALDLAEQHKVEVFLTLAWSPSWASARPNDKGHGPQGAVAEPKNMADWQNYVETIATKYKGRIKDYEIWNEPNSKGFYSGSIPQLVQLAQIAYTTIKRVDPSAIVTSPPVAGDNLNWLEDYLKAGGGKYADVIGHHFYVNPGPPELMVPLIEHVRQIMERNGVGHKALWDTETGWAIQDQEGTVQPATGGGFNGIVLSENQAAGYVARSYILNWAAGAERLYWYAWDDGVMGLAEKDWKTPKAAGIAYEQVEKWLGGARMTSCGSDAADVWTCAITRPGGYHGWIVWEPKGPASFAVPTQWKVGTIRELNGTSRPLGKAQSIQIGPSPLLLESSAPM